MTYKEPAKNTRRNKIEELTNTTQIGTGDSNHGRKRAAKITLNDGVASSPKDTPQNPAKTYKNGSANTVNQKKKFRSFEKAKKFVYKLGLKSQPEWSRYCKSGQKPDDIPTRPDKTYKNKGWDPTKDYGDWLGTGNVSETIHHRILKDIPENSAKTYKKVMRGTRKTIHQKKKLRSFEEARKWSQIEEHARMETIL